MRYELRFERPNMNDDNIVTIKEILGLDIKVKTNQNEERNLRLIDFINTRDCTLTIGHSDYLYNPSKQITIVINCDGYSLELI